MSHQLFTLGHSAMEFPTFLRILQKSEIGVLADVRSNPRSQRFPHFDQIELQGALPSAGIRYIFLGDELGGRPEDPKYYRSDGLVDYRARRKSRSFADGIQRVLSELERTSLVLICAEEDPLNCHRFLMICPELLALGIEPVHIRKGGIRESQRTAEDRLLRTQKMAAVAGASLFPQDRGDALEAAYLAQSQTYAFRIDPGELDIW